MDNSVPWTAYIAKPVAVKTRTDVEVPMRDGTVLRCDLYLPDALGTYPALLARTPYNKACADSLLYNHPAWYARFGYAVVVQDVRGKWASDGEFYPYKYEAADGYDTIQWIARQSWSNGQVGMFDMSYSGATQLLAATQRPSPLKTIVPAFTGSDFYDGWTYRGGALQLAFILSWSVSFAIDLARKRGDYRLEEKLTQEYSRVSCYFPSLPLNDFPILERKLTPFFYDWLEHETYDDYWKQWSVRRRYHQIEVPALHIGGWYDTFLEGTIENFLGLREQGLSERASNNQKLVIGPWWHMPWCAYMGALDFGPAAVNFIDDLQLKWFDYWLKGVDNGIVDEPPVALFVMGQNRWQFADQWPPRGVTEVCYYLHSDGRANSSGLGNGRLDQAPPGEEVPDVFVYNPRAPVYSVGGHSCCYNNIAPMGPADQRSQENRNDILVYTSEPLAEDLLVTGTVKVLLYASSSARDTDFTAKLIDVHPSGACLNVCDGIIRARFRESLERPSLIEPVRVYAYDIVVGSTCQCFFKGHRLRLEISSSNFPHYDRNGNSGRPIATVSLADYVVATQHIFHDSRYPSKLILPIQR